MSVETFIKSPSARQADSAERITAVNLDDLGADHRTLTISVLDMLERAHRKTHQGKLYSVSTVFSGLANNGTGDLIIDVTATNLHLVYDVNFFGDATFQVFEDAVTSSTGTVMIPVNFNRNIATTTASTCFRNPGISSTGSTLASYYLPGGGILGPSGSHSTISQRQGVEWILGIGKKYLFRVTNLSGSTSTGSVNLSFYEQT